MNTLFVNFGNGIAALFGDTQLDLGEEMVSPETTISVEAVERASGVGICVIYLPKHILKQFKKYSHCGEILILQRHVTSCLSVVVPALLQS